MAPLLGLPRLPVVTPAPRRRKAAHAVPWTGRRPWVWLDNDIGELDAASGLARAVRQPHLCVHVDPATGLTARHAELARAWLAGEAPGAGAGAFEDVTLPCGHPKCPWARPGGGLPEQGRPARRAVPLTAAATARPRYP